VFSLLGDRACPDRISAVSTFCSFYFDNSMVYTTVSGLVLRLPNADLWGVDQGRDGRLKFDGKVNCFD
jgi:hypothetical protein